MPINDGARLQEPTSRRSCRTDHIRPVASGGEHRLDNGVLLRSDVHTLYDRGYLGVDRNYRLMVSRRLRDDFSNGDQYLRNGRTCHRAA